MLKRTLFALALAAALPMSAQASEVSYSYIQAGYASTDLEGSNFDGWNLNGSVGFGDSSFYGFGGYRTGDETSVDLNETHLGVGWHSAGDAQWFAEVSWIRDQIDYGFGSFDDNGRRFRRLIGEKFEGNVKANYTDVGDFGDCFGVGLAGIVHFNDTWGAYASYDYSDRSDFDLDTWGVGVRASF